MTRYLAIALVLIASLGTAPSVKACTTPPPATVLRFIIISFGPPITITLIFDPWETVGSDGTDFCSAAFRFPTDLIDTVDDVRLVETGTNDLVSGFGTWTSNVTTSEAVDGILPAAPGKEWFAFLNDLSGNVAQGTFADFQVDVTLLPNVTQSQLFKALSTDSENIVFTDGAESDGTPTGEHQGFTDATLAVPAVSTWGLLVMVLLTLTAGAIVFRRLRNRPVPA